MKPSISTVLAAQLLLMACGGKPAATTEPPAASPTSEPSSALPPSHPPIAAQPSNTAAAPDGPGSAGGLTWKHGEPLVRRAPKSSMRAAEYGVSGDAQAELTVFYFGPDQGGSVDANVTRWLGQLAQSDGSDTKAKAKRSTRDVGGISVTLVEASGQYAGGMGMPGAPAAEPITDAMLLGAIASGPQGPVFFKLVGPRATVEGARGAFDALLGSLAR